MSKNESITVVSGTNRPGSHTIIIAKYAADYLSSRGLKVNFVDLAETDPGMLSRGMYEENGQAAEVRVIQDTHFETQSKFVFVAPEYNGSIPGVLKVFIDALSVRKYSETFFHKKACLIGVASGRAGNIRGLDHLSDILTYLGMIIFPAKLPVSRVFEFLEDGRLTDEEVRSTLKKLLDDFADF
jgi:chromate reductase, NAD(P)H dehydrogenase (quinone)